MDEQTLQKLQETLGYKFKNTELPDITFTHSSAADDRLQSNERLEFLGDSVLNLIICRKLFDRFDDYLEGDLTKIKSMLVSRRTCSKIAKELNLQDFLRTGKGMTSSRALAGSISAGLVEAVIAAIYLDGGYEAAEDFVLRAFGDMIDKADAKHSHGNFKSLLQQHCQRVFDTIPAYSVLDEKGPEHDKCFEIGVIVGQRTFLPAWGNSKKEAEQRAAYNALIELDLIMGKADDEDDFNGEK